MYTVHTSRFLCGQIWFVWWVWALIIQLVFIINTELRETTAQWWTTQESLSFLTRRVKRYSFRTVSGGVYKEQFRILPAHIYVAPAIPWAVPYSPLHSPSGMNIFWPWSIRPSFYFARIPAASQRPWYATRTPTRVRLSQPYLLLFQQ